MAKGTASLDNHPPYFEMISEAISTLKDRTGSSQQAIAKFIEDKYKSVLPPNFKKILSVQLKKFAKSERLVKIKNSFKISSTENVKVAVKETQKKKGTTKKEKAAKKRTEVLKKATKMKRLSQVKTPDVLKKKKNLTPMKRKNNVNSGNSSRPAKKAKK